MHFIWRYDMSGFFFPRPRTRPHARSGRWFLPAILAFAILCAAALLAQPAFTPHEPAAELAIFSLPNVALAFPVLHLLIQQ